MGGRPSGRRDEQLAEALDTLKRLQAIEELRARCLETRQLVEVSLSATAVRCHRMLHCRPRCNTVLLHGATR